jgi:hypothetical protein
MPPAPLRLHGAVRESHATSEGRDFWIKSAVLGALHPSMSGSHRKRPLDGRRCCPLSAAEPLALKPAPILPHPRTLGQDGGRNPNHRREPSRAERTTEEAVFSGRGTTSTLRNGNLDDRRPSLFARRRSSCRAIRDFRASECRAGKKGGAR